MHLPFNFPPHSGSSWPLGTIELGPNKLSALIIKEGATSYLRFQTLAGNTSLQVGVALVSNSSFTCVGASQFNSSNLFVGLTQFNAQVNINGGWMVFTDAMDQQFGTTTGTRIGTATTQKLSFYGSTAIVQPGGSTDATSFVAGAGTPATSTSTWTGGVGATTYTVGGILRCLKLLGLLKS